MADATDPDPSTQPEAGRGRATRSSTPRAPDTEPQSPSQHPTLVPDAGQETKLATGRNERPTPVDPPSPASPPRKAPVEIAFSPANAPAGRPDFPGDDRRTLTSPAAAPQAQNTTLQSLSRPGPSSSAAWDERRVVHLEREIDQLTARARLSDKRLHKAERQIRWLIVAGLCLLLFLLAARLLR